MTSETWSRFQRLFVDKYSGSPTHCRQGPCLVDIYSRLQGRSFAFSQVTTSVKPFGQRWSDLHWEHIKTESISHHYDAVSDLVHNWVAQRPDLKSVLRVVKMVLNTQCYQYLWLTIWFHAKSRKKRSKTQNRWFYNVNSAPEPRNDKNCQKNNH